MNIIDGPGRYVTEAGFVAIVESWDGYRRAYGRDPKDFEISWYVKDGVVRSGSCTGNKLIKKLQDQ